MREEILAAAEKLFAQKGFSRTTLRDLSRESGANTALVSYYFGSKKGLRQAVIERQLHRAMCAVGPVVENAGGDCQGHSFDPESFARCIDGVFESIQSDPTFMRLMLAALSEDDPEVRAEMKTFLLEPLFQGVCEMIRKLVGPHSTLSEVEIRARALLFCGQMHHFSLVKWTYLREVVEGLSFEALLDTYRKIVVSALLSLRSATQPSAPRRSEESPRL